MVNSQFLQRREVWVVGLGVGAVLVFMAVLWWANASEAAQMAMFGRALAGGVCCVWPAGMFALGWWVRGLRGRLPERDL